MIRKGLILIAFFVIVFAFLFIGGYSTGLSISSFSKSFLKFMWGESIWAIPPSWALLYGLVAISGWLVWIHAPAHERIFPMMIYFAVLTANSTWWWVFVKFADPDLAFMNLAILWGLTLLNIVVFFFHSAYAAILLIPYFAWVSYVLVFNYLLLKY